MDSPAAIRGTFADFRLIKSRKVAQLVVELPIEEADAALVTLGGLPQPAAERWVALAALNVTSLKPQRERQAWDSLKLAQQAGIRCTEQAFHRFMKCPDEKATVARVHEYCGIDSRTGLNDNPRAAAKWVELDTQFQLWMRDVG